MDHNTARKAYLDGLVTKYETQAFIQLDPISVPHGFDDPADQEIIGLFAALLAWGQRKTVLSKLADLCERMDFKPHAFVYNFNAIQHESVLAGFKHRTFQPSDAVWLIQNLSSILKRYQTIERAFAAFDDSSEPHVGPAIQGFSDLLFSIHPETPRRLRKHLARPSTGSACKRLCMYLRWMVRPGPVDLGIWTQIAQHKLVLPLDVHSGRQARALGFLTRKQDDWRAALELTEACKLLCAQDPAKYDYAFFGVGAYKEPLDARFIVNPTPAK
ncbi:MAG: TIGR02757 family protein [Bacteroidota bacterium]